MKYRSLLLAMVLCLPMAMHAGDAKEKTKAQIGLVLAVGVAGAAGGFAGAHYWNKQERDANKQEWGALKQECETHKESVDELAKRLVALEEAKQDSSAAASSTSVQPQDEHWKDELAKRVEANEKGLANMKKLVGADVLSRGQLSILATLAQHDEKFAGYEKSRLVEDEASSSANAEEPAE